MKSNIIATQNKHMPTYNKTYYSLENEGFYTIRIREYLIDNYLNATVHFIEKHYLYNSALYKKEDPSTISSILKKIFGK